MEYMPETSFNDSTPSPDVSTSLLQCRVHSQWEPQGVAWLPQVGGKKRCRRLTFLFILLMADGGWGPEEPKRIPRSSALLVLGTPPPVLPPPFPLRPGARLAGRRSGGE